MVSQTGKYLYCIIRCGEERAFADVAPVGGDSASIYAVPHHGLAVVESDAAAGQYDITRANMLAHQRVQERVMEDFTILPVRFGTIAEGPSPADNLCRLLEKRGEEFERLLAEMEGKMELGLKALWRDERGVFEEIVAQDESIRRLRDSLKGKPPAAIRFEGIRLGEMVKGALERRKRNETAAFLTTLQRIAHSTVENKVIVDRMVMNAAFLLEKQRVEEFDQEVDRLDREHGQQVNFRYTGPTPPYNFVNIVVNWLDL